MRAQDSTISPEHPSSGAMRRLRAAVLFDSSYGLHETATTLDIPSRWDPRANQSPTGALVAVLRTAALFDSRMGQIKNALAQCAKAFL